MGRKLCGACNGNGWVPNPNMDIHDPNSPDHVDCNKCDGEGWVDEDDES